MSVFRLLIDDLSQTFGARLLVLLVLMTIVAMGEGLGISLLLPLLNSIGVSQMPGETGLQQAISNLPEMLGLGSSVFSIMGLAISIFFAQMLLSIGNNWWVASLQRQYAAQWQRRLFGAFISARWSFFADKKAGELVNAITTETSRLAGAFNLLAQIAIAAIIIGVYTVIALAVSWQATLALLFVGLVLLVGARGITKKTHQIGVRLGPLNAELNVQTTEFLTGAKLIKATATEDRARQRINRLVDELRVNYRLATFLPGLVRGIFEFVSLTALCLILVFGHGYLNIAPANLLVVLALFVRLFPKINMFQQYVQVLNTYAPAIQITTYLEEKAIAEREHTLTAVGRGEQTLSGSVTVSIQKAGYGDIVTLKNINIVFPKYGFVGIVGESGAGKSTLANCMLGLSDIISGDIRIGELSIRDISTGTWRKYVGYVPQETILFHATIRENIAWANSSATFEEVERAARRASAHEFIMALPEGYDTVIGDQGTRLSGGQRQRIGIARALLGSPKVLLLDEATSALDSASERAILETITVLRQEICIVSIAHRLGSVRDTDNLIVMKDGSIVESGTWEELISKQGYLTKLALSQHIL